MPESLLTILKFCFLAVLYLFFVRVVRAVWAEVVGPRAAMAAPTPAPSPARARRERAGSRGLNRLRIVEPPESKGRTFELGDELTIGRAAGCQVPIDDPYASQLHARLFKGAGGQLQVEDLGSTNGTYLNRKRVDGPVPFRKGDRLQVGKTVMELTR